MDIFHNWFGIGWTRLSNKSYKIDYLYFWQYVCDSLPPLPLSKNHFFFLFFWNWVDLPPSLLDNVFKYTVCFFWRVPLSQPINQRNGAHTVWFFGQKSQVNHSTSNMAATHEKFCLCLFLKSKVNQSTRNSAHTIF